MVPEWRLIRERWKNMFNKGSEWRKWDLHIHSPESGMSNNFGGNWDDYVKVLFQTAIENDVAVLGITDYFTIDGYKKIKNDYLNNETKLHELFDENEIIRIKNINIFPNIEFRLKTIIGTSRVNYHVIFSDEVSINDIEENFLHDIEFAYEHYPFEPTNKSKLKKNNLIELGAKLKKEQPTFTKSDFEIGCQTAVVDDEQIREILLTKKNKFNDKYIIIIPIDEDLSDISWNGQDHNVRKNYLQLANAFFATNQKTIDFGLGKKHTSEKEFLEEFKSLKPCLCGCDAHSCVEIKEWLGRHIVIYNASNSSKIDIEKKITWIKADTTFEGLRQILYEPEERVYIGKDKPDVLRQNCITSIQVPNTNWFPTETIELNNGLVSIIGSRGSGKTALLDIVSVALYAYDGGKASFIKKAENEITPLQIVRSHTDMASDTIDFPNDSFDQPFPYARYLSQQFVERLCSATGASEDLVKEIEIFVFNELEEYQRYGTNNFGELRDYLCTDYDSRINELNNKITLLSNNIADVYKAKGTVSTKEKQIQELIASVGRIRLPVIDTVEKQQKIEKHDKLNKDYAALSLELTKLNENKEELSSIIVYLEKLNQAISEKISETLKKLSHFNLTPQEKSLFTTSISSEAINLLKIKLVNINSLMRGKIGDLAKPVVDTLNWYKLEIQKLNAGLDGITENEKNYIRLNKYVQDKNAEIEELKKNVAELKLLSIDDIQNQRIEKYRQIFVELKNKYQILENLYKPLIESLDGDIHNKSLLSFYIKIDVDFASWTKTIENLIDLRKDSKSLIKSNELLKVVTSTFSDAWQTCDPEKAVIAMQNFYETSHYLSSILKDSVPRHEFASLLFSTNHIKIAYEIKYDGISIERLSPGTRGIVLMILFLKIDKNDNRPLLIDQPEDNLDPESVYKILVPYFKEAKKRRQIIMVTHNPNLVVGTDSEQIIIEKQEKNPDNILPKFSYISRGLEDKVIINKVCSILEGGISAFERRKKRYFSNL
jgi:ABC-type lipoprotein export system ATPase subunit